jgi:hypothetical protein
MKTLKALAWNTTVSLGSLTLGVVVTAGFLAIGTPAFVAGAAGTAAYIYVLLTNAE